MKNLHLILFCLITFIGFGQNNTTLSYSQQLIQSKERILQSSDSTFHKIIHNELIECIFPRWYNTPWDYNGYTNTPKQGVIACGYFVSTTLKHIGFNLNRYDIAKMYSSAIVKVLCHNDYEVKNSYKDFSSYCSQLNDGLYILGLSNHVGFLSIETGEAYFIHSDYSSEKGVRKEKIEDSFALKNSYSFWVGNFSNQTETYLSYFSHVEYLKI